MTTITPSTPIATVQPIKDDPGPRICRASVN